MDKNKRKQQISSSMSGSNSVSVRRANFEKNSSTFFQKAAASTVKHFNSFFISDKPKTSSVTMAKNQSLNFMDISSKSSNQYYSLQIKNKRSYKIAQLMQFFEHEKHQYRIAQRIQEFNR